VVAAAGKSEAQTHRLRVVSSLPTTTKCVAVRTHWVLFTGYVPASVEQLKGTSVDIPNGIFRITKQGPEMLVMNMSVAWARVRSSHIEGRAAIDVLAMCRYPRWFDPYHTVVDTSVTYSTNDYIHDWFTARLYGELVSPRAMSWSSAAT
jgi:hypothetical protein